MRFVKEENKLRFFKVSGFRQIFIKFAQNPQKESCIKHWRLHKLICSKDVYNALSVRCLHQIVNIEHRFTEELISALIFQYQQTSLNGSDRCH